jgi:HEPN domain-containing protein
MSGPHELWLTRAENDLAFAALGLQYQYFSQVCFPCQQASEKALKALLIAGCQRYPRVHNLVELVNRCKEWYPRVVDFEDLARTLDQYYIPSRYPDGVPGSLSTGEPAEHHAREALELATRIVSFCKGQAPGS